MLIAACNGTAMLCPLCPLQIFEKIDVFQGKLVDRFKEVK